MSYDGPAVTLLGAAKAFHPLAVLRTLGKVITDAE
jgi:hypothetical protein